MMIKKRILKKCFAGIFGTIAISFTVLAIFFHCTTGNASGFIRFAEAAYILRSRALHSNQDLIDGAIFGMTAALEDRYSTYYYGEAFERFQDQLSGQYDGIEVYLGEEAGHPYISGLIPGGSGEESGIKAGDILLSVDGTSVESLAMEEIANRVRGEAGTTVTLEVQRDGQILSFAVPRKKITVETVYSRMMDDKTGYIQIRYFSDHTAAEFAKAFTQLKEKGMDRWILDLRFNPGGNLEETVKIAELFFPKGNVVQVVDKNSSQEVYAVNGVEKPLPMAVLVNEQSASASEILAGAIQDYGLGKVIGTTTYGKGSVQGIYPIGENRVMKITIAKYLTPNGREIDGIGVAPDIEVPFSFENGYDHQLERAREVLNS